MTGIVHLVAGPVDPDPIPCPGSNLASVPVPVPVLIAREGDLEIGEVVHLAVGRNEAIFLGVTAGGRFAFAWVKASRPHRFVALAAPIVILQPGDRPRGGHARRTARET